MATIAEAIAAYDAESALIQAALNGRGFANEHAPDAHLEESSLFEGLYMHAFTTFERLVETAFLQYCTGGVSIHGVPAKTLLNVKDLDKARALIKGDSRYLDWSNPEAVRRTAGYFIDGGEPFQSAFSVHSSALADAQKLRNAIAHSSIEAQLGFKAVQVRQFSTERTFPMSVGHLLRTRRKKKPQMHWGAYYVGVLQSAAHLICYHH